MAPEVMLQVAIIILALAIYIAVHKLSKQPLTKLRFKNRVTIQLSRHMLQASHLITRARSTSLRSQSIALAKKALLESEKALLLSPKDPALHILKALSLDLIGHRNSALKSLDVALSPPCVKSLTDHERGDALVKRADLKLAVNRRRRVESAIEDLVEAVSLNESNSRAFCLLAACYELKDAREKAKLAFEKALMVDPGSVKARDGLNRLGS